MVVEVTGHRAEPLENTEICAIVVDESVLALIDYKLTDMLTIFYPNRYGTLSAQTSRVQILTSP